MAGKCPLSGAEKELVDVRRRDIIIEKARDGRGQESIREMSVKQILFFALKDDLLPVLDAVEGRSAIKYVLAGNFARPALEVFFQGWEIPNLGKATADQEAACDMFLVCNRELPINMRVVEQTGGGGDPYGLGLDQFVNTGVVEQTGGGGDRYCVDQLINPDTVCLTPGGVWNDDVVLQGRVASVSETKASRVLMKQFRSAVRKHFVRIKAFYVGMKARELLEAGKRLTGAVQSPREFDLTS